MMRPTMRQNRAGSTVLMNCLVFVVALTAHAESPNGKLDEYRNFALRGTGSAADGQRLFEQSEKLSCTDCHRITGMEKSGPNLDGIGDKYARAELIRHILTPNESIKPGYDQAVITTVKGRVLNGRLERATKLGVRLIDLKGKQVNLNTEDIEEIHFPGTSLMPDNVVAAISKEQFADLIAYLQSLKYGIKEGLTSGGRPVPIPRLRHPIQFKPIHPKNVVFENPVWCGTLPGVSHQLLVVEHQKAKVWRYVQGVARKELFVDLGSDTYISGNQGVMCIAFHPDYQRNGRYFVEHEVKEEGKVKTTVVERLAAPNRLVDSGRPSVRLLEVEQPAFNHNGGCIAFGKDGMLYAAFGDGGPQKDPAGNSQNARELLGSMVRIDVDRRDGQRPYAIPADNPFLKAHHRDASIRPETWAIGFREPWRFSFDAVTGALWVGDVGQDRFEEVSVVQRGENHGWNVREAFSAYSDEYRRQGEVYSEPLFAYEHGLGFSVTGGHVYRGSTDSSFYGVYIFGDYNTRRVWGLRQRNGVLIDVRELGTAPGGIVSFGVDDQGELLLVTYEGTIFHLDLSVTVYE